MTEHEFLQEIILVMVPTVAGIVTTKWITNSWQDRKEKLELRKQILDEFNEGIPTMLSLLGIRYSTYIEIQESFFMSHEKEYKKFEEKYRKQHPEPDQEFFGDENPVEDYEMKMIEEFFEKYSDESIESKIKNEIQKQREMLFLPYLKSKQFINSLPLYFIKFEQLRKQYVEIYNEMRKITSAINGMQYKRNWFDRKFVAELNEGLDKVNSVSHLIDKFALELVNSKIKNPKM